MAFLELHFHAESLGMEVAVNVILPEIAKKQSETGKDMSYKTMYLFHGLSDDYSMWMRRTSIERYATEYGIAVVMPSVARSWYTDTISNSKYFTFVTKELPDVCRSYFRGMSHKREDTIVAGLSMGGYGAIKAALSCPERFGYCASLSGALDLSERSDYMDDWRGIFDYQLKSPLELKDTQHDVFAIARKNYETEIPFPRLYMWCGESDSFYKCNRRFHAMLDEFGVEHLYEESEGGHSWPWWDQHIQSALKYLLGDPV